MLYRARLIFQDGKELLDDGTGVLLAVLKRPIVKALLGSAIQGALVKTGGLPGFIKLLGFQQSVF
ncbi:hypothetical protein D3C78_1894370 [compost metagenome]